MLHGWCRLLRTLRRHPKLRHFISSLPFDAQQLPFELGLKLMAAASRTDLLGWLNDLLQINYTKIEQCGTGAAYCQILDSIYGVCPRHRPLISFIYESLILISRLVDLPMTRVKMNAKHEYEFIANFKVLQNVFKAKKIEKARLLYFLSYNFSFVAR